MPTKENIQKVEKKTETLTSDQLFKLAEIQHYGKYGRSVDVNKARETYLLCIKKSTNKMNKCKCYLGLAALARNSSPPNGNEAIHWYMNALENSCEDAALDIAEIYSNGLHPYYLPNKLIAGRLYTVIAHNKSFSENIRAYAISKLKEVSYADLDSTREPGRSYIELPNIADSFQEIVSKPQSWIASNIVWIPTSSKQEEEPEVHFEIVPYQEVHNDSQNVHSSSINNAAIKNISNIQKDTKIQNSFESNANAFFIELGSLDMSEESKKNAKRVVESLKDTIHSKYDMSEKDVFNIVWSRINDPINATNRSDMLMIFAQNLSSGIEHNHTVCSTGKIIRMIGSLDSVDAGKLENLKPEWAIKEEIASLCAKIRSDVLMKCTDSERKAYEKGQSESVTKQMQDALRERCRIDYVQSNILTEEALELVLRDYIESF